MTTKVMERLGVLAMLLLAAAVLLVPFTKAQAQTDYYNTDAGRPLTIEDAHPVERRAFELQVAPLRLERGRGGVYHWGFAPEVAYGILPRTQIEIAIPMLVRDVAGLTQAGLAGLEVSAMYNLNTETRLPAFAIAADYHAPVGGMAPSRATSAIKAIATKTTRLLRVHVNTSYTVVGGAVDYEHHGDDFEHGTRWQAGVAFDRPFPLNATLLGAEIVARQPTHHDEPVEWSAALGMRRQVSPRVATDLGAGTRLTGNNRGSFITMGAAVAIGLPWRGAR